MLIKYQIGWARELGINHSVFIDFRIPQMSNPSFPKVKLLVASYTFRVSFTYYLISHKLLLVETHVEFSSLIAQDHALLGRTRI